MLPPPVEFTLLDDAGNPHGYVVPLHPAVEGQRLMCQILALAAGPLADLATAYQRTDGNGLDADVDLAAVGRQMGAALASDAPPRLIRDLLRYTARDGKALAQDGGFNDAYTGNYGELLFALWEVVKANRFLPLSRITAIVAPKATPTANPTPS